ncbi:CDP-glucose 4,6-dehydratase [Sphingomonas sp. KC8]|uniref:CDP-glucose 4,6-dehydratase n=1 Tax=Sphingomonas sp. KC8 TaxID=1030157 RepID=UPI000248988B|nr:CDP-glucose 4,6-dehydratase [Sphingomonas sp. KC8]ARS27244.1 hypothetical protein KC8_08060 [Sphingomonas sp. KC8]
MSRIAPPSTPERPIDEAFVAAALRGRRVLVTGHTGFKGGWLSLWLRRLGADVVGIALPPQGSSFHVSTGLDQLIDHRIADIRDARALADAANGIDAELVVHMAAQAIVRQSYAAPAETFATNVTGTANVLDMARAMPSLRAVIVVTSDKCYENHEWPWPYRETDMLGGSDPYSASKACTEIVATAYRRSYFNDRAGPQLATVRAGNVIGGGDWAEDRLIPDIVRAALSGQSVQLRNPRSIRPWQHVLEPLAGYLTLAAHLLSSRAPDFAEAWNFGPDPAQSIDVETLARGIVGATRELAAPLDIAPPTAAPPEARLLRLDSSKAAARLGWKARLPAEDMIRMTTDWYAAFARGDVDMRSTSEAQIAAYAQPVVTPAQQDFKRCA